MKTDSDDNITNGKSENYAFPEDGPLPFESMDAFVEKEFEKRGSDASRIDRKIEQQELRINQKIEKESAEWSPEEKTYQKFIDELPGKIALLYAKIYPGENQKDGDRQNLALAVILHRDQRLYTLHEETRLEITVEDYIAREALDNSAQPLSKEENDEYHRARAVIALNNALDATEQNKEYLDKAFTALKNVCKDVNKEDIQAVYDILIAYEKME